MLRGIYRHSVYWARWIPSTLSWPILMSSSNISLDLRNCIFHSEFSEQSSVCTFHLSHTYHMFCSSKLLNFMTLILVLFCEGYKLWNSSCNIVHNSVTSSILTPNNPVGTPMEASSIYITGEIPLTSFQELKSYYLRTLHRLVKCDPQFM
jgi:hypothetical protein